MTLLRRLHYDQRGTMSIVSVFTILFLAMLLGMVMNVARQADGKIRMQNAADAAAYSGAVVMARGLNTLAFTNHLLCEVLAMRAFLQEANTRIEADDSVIPAVELKRGEAETQARRVLDAWRAAWTDAMNVLKSPEAISFRQTLAKFESLGDALLGCGPCGRPGLIAREEKMIDRFSMWAKQTAVCQLAMFDEMLEDELIPKYQRAVAEYFPVIAQTAAEETARQNGRPDFGRGDMTAALWTGQGVQVSIGGASGALPAATPTGSWLEREQRRQLSEHYLETWNSMLLWFFDFDRPFNQSFAQNRKPEEVAGYLEGRQMRATLSQFANIWRRFTRDYLGGQSGGLLTQYYDTNHLYQIGAELQSTTRAINDDRAALQRSYSVLATVYWRSLPHFWPGFLHDPTGADSIAYAEARLQIAQPRLMAGGNNLPQYHWHYVSGFWFYAATPEELLASVPVPADIADAVHGAMRGDLLLGYASPVPYRQLFSTNYQSVYPYWREPPTLGTLRQPYAVEHLRPDEWTLLNQNWSAQLVPATNPFWHVVLTTPPVIASLGESSFTLPDLSGFGTHNVQRISTH